MAIFGVTKEKIKYAIHTIPYRCLDWFRNLNDWTFWKTPRTAKGHILKKAVNALFKAVLHACLYRSASFSTPLISP
jgi:hypothetical protein